MCFPCHVMQCMKTQLRRLQGALTVAIDSLHLRVEDRLISDRFLLANGQWLWLEKTQRMLSTDIYTD